MYQTCQTVVMYIGCILTVLGDKCSNETDWFYITLRLRSISVYNMYLASGANVYIIIMSIILYGLRIMKEDMT